MTDFSFTSPLSSPDIPSVHADQQTLTRYYQFHAKIYDATRWSFLFGRRALIDSLGSRCRATRILEVGCGTGRNLKALALAYPKAEITGIDLSPDMLAVAKQNLVRYQSRVQLRREVYGSNPTPEPRYDLVLFSYALTMFNTGWEEAIAHAKHELSDGGGIAVVDFHRSSLSPFARWMAVNHVHMDGHLLPKLCSHFSSVARDIVPAYGGLWQYFLFIGRK